MKTSSSYELALTRFAGCLRGLGATDIEPHVDAEVDSLTLAGVYDGDPFILRPSRADVQVAESGSQEDWEALRRKFEAAWPA
ncbi:MAG: hypothetical protein SFV54_14675 [Bryobacteraceae bacterium]|nr:hypothetical protein [Bryobacteraceae bacterium]